MEIVHVDKEPGSFALVEEHDLLVAINGILCCCFDMSITLDQWRATFSHIGYPLIYSFFKVSNQGQSLFIPSLVFFFVYCYGSSNTESCTKYLGILWVSILLRISSYLPI